MTKLLVGLCYSLLLLSAIALAEPPLVSATELETMQQNGYSVSFINPDMAELQHLAQQVIKKNGISRFLIKAYGENPGCSIYFSQEFTPYAIR